MWALISGSRCSAVSLAGSLFFSLSPDASRQQVLLYLLINMAPFALLAPLAGPSCSNDTGTGALPPDVKAIVFLQRVPRGDQGNVFDYQSYAGGGRLVMLKPPGADGTPTTLRSGNTACSA